MGNNKQSKSSSALSRTLSSNPIPQLRDAIAISNRVSSLISIPDFNLRIIPESPTLKGEKVIGKGKVEQTRKEIFIPEVFALKREKVTYWGYAFDDVDVFCVYDTKNNKILSASVEVAGRDTSTQYISTKATVKARYTTSSRVARIGEAGVEVSEYSLEPATYCAFNSPNSAVILNNTGRIIGVLVEEGDGSDLYLSTKATVSGNLSRASGWSNPFGIEKAVLLSEATLQSGTYRAFSSADAVFIFDDRNIAAILVRQDEEWVPYIAAKARSYGYIWNEGESTAKIEVGIYNALVGPDNVILDATGKLIQIW